MNAKAAMVLAIGIQFLVHTNPENQNFFQPCKRGAEDMGDEQNRELQHVI
jgi:hypothetical protein